MPRTGERGGPQTRARIAEVAAGLFLERGFEAVTVADVARAAGVSSVTVFKHFPTKEDLFLDRSVDAADLLRTAARAPGPDVLSSLQAMTLQLADDHHPLSGLREESQGFFRTVADSPALVARARSIAADLERTLAEEPSVDPLLAAFFVAGYRTVLVDTARRRLAGDAPDDLADDHRARLGRLFDALRGGVPTPP